MLNYTTRVGRIGEITWLADKVRQLADGRIRFDLPTGAFQGACIDLGKLGFGLYTCEIQGRIDALPISSVVSSWLYADSHDFELDFEESRWGDPNNPNGQMLSYYAQPQTKVAVEQKRFPSRCFDRYRIELLYRANEVGVKCYGIRPNGSLQETAWLHRTGAFPSNASWRIGAYNREACAVRPVATLYLLDAVRTG